MTDLSNKPISYTGSHPLELAYRALLARAEAAEALAAERLEDALFAEQRATDAEIERDEAVGLTIREIARLLGVTYEEAALVLRAAAHLIDQRAQLEAQP